MSTYLTEEEQVERIKDLWKQYGNAILTGVAVVALATAGWKFWQNRQYQVAASASAAYQTLIDHQSKGDHKGVAAQANFLKSKHEKSPYAQYAALFLAKQAADEAKYDVAEQNLQWVLKHTEDKALQQIALVRMARIQIAQNQPKAALATLDTVVDDAFAPLINETRGDAYRLAKQKTKALEAYKLALVDLSPEDKYNRPLLQMKVTQLQ